MSKIIIDSEIKYPLDIPTFHYWYKRYKKDPIKDIKYLGKDWGLILTHDVDSISKLKLTFSQRIKKYVFLLRRNFISKDILIKSTKRIIKKILYGFYKRLYIDPKQNILNIMNIERKLGVTSTWFFLANSKDFFGGTRYSLKEISDILITLNDHGFEIGLHAGFFSYLSYEDVKEEKKIIERVLGHKIKSVRSHYLRLRIFDTWRIYKKAGFIFDSTYGFSDRPGWRSLYQYPFEIEKLGIYEFPVSFMDISTGNLKNLYLLLRAVKRKGVSL